MMWPSGRFQPWELISFQYHIILSKYIVFAVPSPFSVHINTLNKVTWHVLSQALLRIIFYHTRLSRHHVWILQIASMEQQAGKSNKHQRNNAMHIRKTPQISRRKLPQKPSVIELQLDGAKLEQINNTRRRNINLKILPNFIIGLE